MKKILALSLVIVLSLPLALIGNGCGESKDVPPSESSQLVAHQYVSFKALTINYLPESYMEFHSSAREELGVDDTQHLIRYFVEFFKKGSTEQKLTLTFDCDDIVVMPINNGEADPEGAYLRDSLNGCWAIYQDDAGYGSGTDVVYMPRLRLYPNNESVGMIIIEGRYGNLEYDSHQEYEQMLADALELADDISASTFSEEDYHEFLQNPGHF